MPVDAAKRQKVEARMSNYPSDYKKGQSRQYPDRIDEIYAFDKASGIYKPHSCEPESPEKNPTKNGQKVNLLDVKIRRDWLSFVISVITLIVLSYYTLVTYKLWLEGQVSGNLVQQELAIAQLQAITANHSADTASRELTEVGKQTTAAQRQLSIAQKQMELADRPWVGIQGPVNVIGVIHKNPASVNFAYDLKNGGKSVALGVETGIWVAGGMAGLALMESNRCEEVANTERQAIAPARQYEKRGGPKPSAVITKTGSIILPDGIEHVQSGPQPDAPNQPTENVYALFCVAYFDELDKVHLTQTMYCFTSRFPGLQDLPITCGKGNYAY
jgi:hypothetical protein